tara:strand:- start:373 stop:558 length:186 start_codon:yes stop_codon:yes gene_type:complete
MQLETAAQNVLLRNICYFLFGLLLKKSLSSLVETAAPDSFRIAFLIFETSLGASEAPDSFL